MFIADYVWNRRGEVANDFNGPGQNSFASTLAAFDKNVELPLTFLFCFNA